MGHNSNLGQKGAYGELPNTPGEMNVGWNLGGTIRDKGFY